jgi:CubicO group peptidase (beta-lactamase class C family)
MNRRVFLGLALSSPLAWSTRLGAREATNSSHPAPTAPKRFEDLRQLLTPIRQQYNLPAVAAAVSKHGAVLGVGAIGLRKVGDSAPVTAADKFHLGSCTKAMTATLAAQLVEQGRLHWDSTLANIFPERAEKMHPGYRKVTLDQLLRHRSGAPRDGNNYGDLRQPLITQRLVFLESITGKAPETEPGSHFAYSNAGYIMAGAMLERVTRESWEDLMTQRLFRPLTMRSAGFGAPSRPNEVDQPWGHVAKEGVFEPRYGDNPRGLGPAGTVHCSIVDYLKFADFHVSKGTRPSGLLLAESLAKLHQPLPGQDYAMGWSVVQRNWAQGTALTHSGSNTMNFFVVWLAPKTELSIAIASNAAGDKVPKALDDVAAELVRRFAG